jgi:PilZ domain
MQLSAEIFERIVDALEVDAPPPAPVEKRREPRTAVHGSVSIIPPGGGPPVRVEARDLSRHGIGLLSKREMAAGEEFVLLIAGDTGAVGVIFSVVHCRAVAPGQYAIGGRVVRFSLRA